MSSATTMVAEQCRFQEWVFSNSGLNSIIIPDGVTNIMRDTFSGCRVPEDIYYGGTETDCDIRIREKANG